MENEDRFIRGHEVRQMVGLCDMHLRRLEVAGKFPRRVKIAPDSGPRGAVGWSLHAVQEWLKARLADTSKDA